MPPTGMSLTTNERNLIGDWIADGAPLDQPTAVTDNAPSSITKTSAVVRGDFNTNVHANTTVNGTYYFRYGITASYGSTTSISTRNSTSTLSNTTKTLTGLACGTLYHYDAVATNGDSTATGVDRTVTTSNCTSPTLSQQVGGTYGVIEDASFVDMVLLVTDDDPGTLTWSITSNGNRGTASVVGGNTSAPVTNGTKTIRYVPTSNQNGADSVTVMITSDKANFKTASITLNISITSVNDQPSITSTAPASAIEDVQYSYPVIVDDPDDLFGAGLGISLTNEPTGMAVNPATGIITWTPANGVTTSGTVTVTVTDGGEDGAVAAVQQFTVGVTGTNDPPFITPGATTTATEDIQYSYQVVVTDIDDTNNGTDISFALSGEPTGMSVSSTGLITWTPLEGVLTSGSVTVTVEDGDEDMSTPTIGNGGQENFTITVTPVNDPPAITSPDPSTSLLEDDNFSYQVVANDVDDPNGLGNDLTVSISNEPAGMTVNSTGLVSWAVPRTGVFPQVLYSNVIVTVADGGEDGAAPDMQQFTLTVSPPDGDADLEPTYSDNCPTVANGVNESVDGNQADNDSDTVLLMAPDPNAGDVDPVANGPTTATGGDACDTDDDNDGMPDTFEAANGFDRFDPADATLDADGDGVSNLQEFLDGTDPTVDSVGPSVTAPADITVDATGFLTVVDLGKPVAIDGNDGSITLIVPVVDVTITDSPTDNTDCLELSNYPVPAAPFRPGSYTVNWYACDTTGNLSAPSPQIVNVRPIVTTTSGQILGEGQVATVEVMLNGEAPSYPVTLNYIVSGEASNPDDHDATNGSVSITDPDVDGNSPGLIGRLPDINIVSDAITEPQEKLDVVLTSADLAVLGQQITHGILIVEKNVTPEVKIDVMQSGVDTGAVVYADGGSVLLSADSFDANPSDILLYQWSDGSTNQTLMFDPNVTPGIYHFSVTVSDGAATSSASINLVVVANAPAAAVTTNDDDNDGLPNNDPLEGAGDSDGDGIPNYLDDNALAENVIQNLTDDPSNSLLLETEAGLSIKLGTTALAAGVNASQLSQADIDNHGGQAGGVGVNTADSYTNTSGFYDFEISGLNASNDMVDVVIPLPVAILPDSEYRKYRATAAGGGWSSFVVDDKNKVKSAKGNLGVCPAPGSPLYKDGLTPFDLCVQLTLQDGGPNDADGVRDFVIRDPGGVATPPAAEAVTPTGSDRIGVLNPVLLALFSLISLMLYRHRRR